MIRISFDPAGLEGEDRLWWDAWEARAREKTRGHAAALARGEQPQFDGGIWSELKAWLLVKVFHGKCAYCENRISGGFFGDAEHFRPKGKVTVPGDSSKQEARLSGGEPHKGYYWLAYDWENLLPSCQRCNNAKSDLFPIGNQYQAEPAPATDRLNATEEPLLIYPYAEDPSKFLKFGKGGVVTAIDANPRGLATIRVLGLDRHELMDERWSEQARALQGLEGEIGRMLSGDELDAPRIAEYMGPKARYSRAVYDWFVERVERVSQRAREAADRALQG